MALLAGLGLAYQFNAQAAEVVKMDRIVAIVEAEMKAGTAQTPKFLEKRSDSAKPDSLSRKTARPMAVAANGWGERLTRLSPKVPRSIRVTSGKPPAPPTT